MEAIHTPGLTDDWPADKPVLLTISRPSFTLADRLPEFFFKKKTVKT